MKHVVITATLIVLFVGCSKEQKQNKQSIPQPTTQTVEYKRLGAAPDSATSVLSLEELLKSPTAYNGKFVVVQGVYGGACGDGDYYFKDKFDMIEFSFDQGSEIEKFKVGTPLLLFGKVKVRTHGEKEEKEKGEEQEASVSIAAKGVQYK